MQWFRFYGGVVNDPKVQKLDAETFKFWINLLCITCNNDGILPSLEDVSFVTRCNKNTVSNAFHILVEADLINVTKNQHGESYSIHNWAKRQFKSDTSTERVRKHREKHKGVTCNVTETPPEQRQNRTEQNRAEYAFEGNVVKLNQKDYEAYRNNCPALTEVEYRKELTNADLAYSNGDDNNWFFRLANYLKNAKPRNSGRSPNPDGADLIEEAMNA